MKRTTKYQLGYFEQGDRTSSSVEMQRWETLDAQIYALFDVLGNGIIDGWNILASSGLSSIITVGSGHVNFVAVKTVENVTLDGLNPNARNYIYAFLTTDSYWTQNVTFTAFITTDENSEGLYLGYVDTNANEVTDVNTDGRAYLGFIDTIQSFVKAHRHIGGENNPTPINLATDVQGTISQKNLPDLDASVIQTGTLDQDRLPLIDHITHLINQGTLTHAQLDSFVEALSLTNPTLMGETSTVDLLQLLLALKHVYPDIDQYLINEIAYIPGISPDNYVDWDNTTATVDVLPASEGGTHTITGVSSAGKRAYTYTWDSQEEFESDTYDNVFINGDQVNLETQESTLVIDEFSDLSNWTVITDDLSSVTMGLVADTSTYVVPPNSAKLNIGGTSVEIALVIQKEFDAQDWSQYKKIVFYLKTESVQHGDVFFYLRDAYAGTQSSQVKILNRNDVTVNVDTLQNGWQEITVDISSYTRTNINLIAFYISSQEGWDTSKGFDFNIDNVYLTTGNYYKEDGYVRVIFGDNFLYDFWRVRWDAQIPTDAQSAGLVLKSRTRVGNTLADLATSIWSSYTSVSGSDISLPAPGLYKYIEIEMYFGASTDLTRTAYLKKIYLDFYAADTENSFNYNTKDGWDSGSLFNIDTNTSPGSMLISNTEEIEDIFYGTESKTIQLDDNLVELYSITGSVLPKSTYQALNSISPSLGLVTGVARGNNGNIWVSDVDNDRVVELDKSGALVKGFYGSFLTPPIDYYGEEEFGPGSNSITAANVAATTTLVLGSKINVLQAIYNSDTGTLYIVFDHDLENIYNPANLPNLNKMYLKIGTQKFYLQDSTVTLLGVDEDKYDLWQGLTTGSDTTNGAYINQFKFTSHVLKIVLNGADKSLLNYMVNPGAPSIVISTPTQQQRVTSDVTVNFILYNFVLGASAATNRIRVTLDGGTSEDIYSTSKTFSGLSVGTHTIQAQLVNADSSLNTNIEAIANGTFVVYSGAYISPYITLTTPKPNQIYADSPVVVEFNIENFPILSTGQHLRYIVDGGSAVDYYSEDPITISDLSAGQHTINLYLVDKNGDAFVPPYTYGSVTGTFNVGLNSLAVTKLYIDEGAIYDVHKSITNATDRIPVDVSNITFANIYSPIDIQVIPADTSKVNPSGLPTVVVAKLRSPSWTNGLSGEGNYQEFLKRLEEQANTTTTTTLVSETTTTTTTSIYSGITTPELIFGTMYLDGHSVVQMDMDANVIMSNNAAKFAETKNDAKDILGSAEKLGDNEFLMGDSCNKRAIITYTDLDTEKPKVEWQFDSDRYIPDFHIVLQNEVTITIRDDSISESSTYIRQGTLVIWDNQSTKPVTIYSGTTSYDQFQLDPDVNLYGDQFQSSVLQPGDRYSFKFVTVGEYGYFAYPDILTGQIIVTQNRISSRDQFIVLEGDGLESPFSSRAIRIDAWGNVLWSFGEAYLVKPRDARPLLNNKVIISV